MRICFIGDSFVNGTNDPGHLGWVGRILARASAEGREITGYNLGIRRDTSRDIAARWQEEAARRLPEDIDRRLVFSFGVNDCVAENGASRVGLEETLATTRTMLAHARSWLPTLMVGPPPIADHNVNERVHILSAAFQPLCAELAVPYADIFTPLATNPVWMAEVAANDGAHPGAAGYQLVADLVEAWPAWKAWMDQPR